MKIQISAPSFRLIPEYVREGSWQCDFEIDRVLPWLERQNEEKDYPIDLDPDFQRPYCWTEEQQIAWLEHILRGGRSGRVLYFNHPGWQGDYGGTLVLVDGKQRIEALRRLMNNEIKIFGYYFNEYTDKPRGCSSTILINVNTLKTRKEVIDWYLQMNGGGTPHTKEELEKARKLMELE